MASVTEPKNDDRIRFLKRSEIFEALGASLLAIVLERGSLESYYLVLSEMRQKGMVA